MRKVYLHYKMLLVIVLASLLFISCDDNDCKIGQEKYFMTAEINGVEWKAEREWFQLDFLHSLGYHRTDIYGETLSSRVIYYNINLDHSYYPQLGKVYFNNTGAEVPFQNGASACIWGWLDAQKNNFYSCHSTSGFVEITEINRYSMKGNFEFEASNNYHPEYGSYVVKKGKFFIPLNLVIGASWDGDYKK